MNFDDVRVLLKAMQGEGFSKDASSVAASV